MKTIFGRGHYSCYSVAYKDRAKSDENQLQRLIDVIDSMSGDTEY